MEAFEHDANGSCKIQDAIDQTYLDDRRTTKQSAWSLRADSKKQPLTSGISIINISLVCSACAYIQI